MGRSLRAGKGCDQVRFAHECHGSRKLLDVRNEGHENGVVISSISNFETAQKQGDPRFDKRSSELMRGASRKPGEVN